MAAARIVMQDWGEKTRLTLVLAKMELALFSDYVDDLRQGGTSLRLGLRYDLTLKSWRWLEEDYLEDMELRRDGETRNERMIRLCLPMINSINEDLVFTADKPEDFTNNKLPTLDLLSNELVRRVSNTNYGN